MKVSKSQKGEYDAPVLLYGNRNTSYTEGARYEY